MRMVLGKFAGEFLLMTPTNLSPSRIALVHQKAEKDYYHLVERLFWSKVYVLSKHLCPTWTKGELQTVLTRSNKKYSEHAELSKIIAQNYSYWYCTLRCYKIPRDNLLTYIFVNHYMHIFYKALAHPLPA